MTIELTADEWGEVLNALETHYQAQQHLATMPKDRLHNLNVGIEKLGLLCTYRLKGDIHLSGQITGIMMDIGDYQHWCRRFAIASCFNDQCLRRHIEHKLEKIMKSPNLEKLIDELYQETRNQEQKP